MNYGVLIPLAHPVKPLNPKTMKCLHLLLNRWPKGRYENTTLGFIVEVEGLPVRCEMVWNKSLLEPDERIKIERVGNVCSLEIASIQNGDGGEYMCHAVNIIGKQRELCTRGHCAPAKESSGTPPPVTHQHVMEFDLENIRGPLLPQEIVLEVELSEKDVKEFESK